jgi:hypothetical protein
MVTTITFAANGKNYRVAIEGDLRNVAFNAERRNKLATRIIRILSARGLKWAKSGLYHQISQYEARLEPTGPNHDSYDTIKGTASYSTLFEEDKAPNIIRDWR